jgi:hypothetical protein
VAGKIQATHRRSSLGMPSASGYRLRGELDLQRLGLAGIGPIDTLRAVCNDLLQCECDKQAIITHHRIAEGLVHLMQRWPHFADADLRAEVLRETIDRVPTEGAASFSIGEEGLFRFEYRQGTVR